MKHVMLPSLCAVAVVASCDPVLAQQPAPVVTTTPPYLQNTLGDYVIEHINHARRSHQAQRSSPA